MLNELGKKELTKILIRTFGKDTFVESELTDSFYSDLYNSGSDFFRNGGDCVNLDFFWSDDVRDWILADKTAWLRNHPISE